MFPPFRGTYAGLASFCSAYKDAFLVRATHADSALLCSAAQVSAKVVKELREKSGAGMMDCKKALGECGGDLDAAADYLRKKGLASAGKKAGRVASEGAIGAYIHAGSRCAAGLNSNSLQVCMENAPLIDHWCCSSPGLIAVEGLAGIVAQGHEQLVNATPSLRIPAPSHRS